MNYCYQIRTSQFGRNIKGDLSSVREVVDAVNKAAGWAKYRLAELSSEPGGAILVGPGNYVRNNLHPGDVVVRVEMNELKVFPWEEFKRTFWKRRPEPVREDWEKEGE